MIKALEPKVTFVIDSTKFTRSLNVPYKKYKFVIRESNRESHSHNHLTCHYCYKKGHNISKCNFRRYLVPRGVFQWLPKFKNVSLTLKDPMKIGYLALLFDLVVECLGSTERMWFLDSGCSKHMMGDISHFIDFTPKKKGDVTYRDNNKGAILGNSSV